jgi:hypothetical protein
VKFGVGSGMGAGTQRKRAARQMKSAEGFPTSVAQNSLLQRASARISFGVEE